MHDPGALLATLAQSSAAIVAIVGGFLVSRLVALSSEREGLRRQLVSVRDELKHVVADYSAAHDYRFANSRDDFIGWVLDDVVAQGADLDNDRVLGEHGVPRGSSVEEMAPVLDDLRVQVAKIDEKVRNAIQGDDDSRLRLSDLIERGLSITEQERDIYEHVVDHVAETELPDPPRYLGIGMTNLLRDSYIRDPTSRAAELRRLDESVRDEQNLLARKSMLEVTVERLERELVAIGRPHGVWSAIWILATYALLGIFVPVMVLAFGGEHLSRAWGGVLIGLFVAGLSAVLGFMLWYARTLDHSVEADDDHGVSLNDRPRSSSR